MGLVNAFLPVAIIVELILLANGHVEVTAFHERCPVELMKLDTNVLVELSVI